MYLDTSKKNTITMPYETVLSQSNTLNDSCVPIIGKINESKFYPPLVKFMGYPPPHVGLIRLFFVTIRTVHLVERIE